MIKKQVFVRPCTIFVRFCSAWVIALLLLGNVIPPPAQAATGSPDGLFAGIQIVWPHDDAGNPAPVQTATKANLLAVLYTHYQNGTLESVPCDWNLPVQLWSSRNTEPPVSVARAVRQMHEAYDTTGRRIARYPVWVVNDVDVRWANDPAHALLFQIHVEGYAVQSSIWVHSASAQLPPPPPLVPDAVASRPVDPVDARFTFVWPHTLQMQSASIAAAQVLNLRVTIFKPGTRTSVGPDRPGSVQLYRALNNYPLRFTGDGVRRIVTYQGLRYPIWDFEAINVHDTQDPANKLTFYIKSNATEHASIWVHAADIRTFMPQPYTVAGGCP